MEHHPYFDLWLHGDMELATLLGSQVVERTTLHEWPLSCVQRLRMVDGQIHIYKAQAPPTAEPIFYARAQSPLLVVARVIDVPDVPAALLLEDVAAPPLVDLQLSEAEAVGVGKSLLEHIRHIAGDLPAVLDIRTVAQWQIYATHVVDDLQSLVDSSTFTQVDHQLIHRFVHQMQASSVLMALQGEMGYVHNDLSGDNAFMLPDGGFRVIDWQRPIWGPVALDLACLIASLGFDPHRYVDRGVIQLLYLLRIGWFAQCARHWFPAGAATYDATIVGLVDQIEHATI